jgi:hypothetical protein
MKYPYSSHMRPLEVVDGKLVLRIPLADGGGAFVEATRGFATVDAEALTVEIPESFAEQLGLRDGTVVLVENRNGEFSIGPVDISEPPA